MLKAGNNLILNQPNVIKQQPLTLHFLTGKNYWYQTAFCIKSLLTHSSRNLNFTLIDDSTMNAELVEMISSQCKKTSIIQHYEIEERLNQSLPENKFPFLRKKRLVYPHIKKLTDIHAGTTGWKIVLDSDMLFYKEPKLMFEWMDSPNNPFHIIDTVTSYGYSMELMNLLANSVIVDRINVGVVGLKSETIEWEKVEYWGKSLEEKEGASYFLEQALTAMIIGENKAVVGPAEEYLVMPTKLEVLHPTAVLHHYVDTSKEWYFKYAWKTIVADN